MSPFETTTAIANASMSPDPELLRTYSKRPQLAAPRAEMHRQRALLAEQVGDNNSAVRHWDRVDEYHAVLDHFTRCRRCGRTLKDPTSVARRIGPECIRKDGGAHATTTEQPELSDGAGSL